MGMTFSASDFAPATQGISVGSTTSTPTLIPQYTAPTNNQYLDTGGTIFQPQRTGVYGATTTTPTAQPAPPPPDPYAQWGGEANYNATRADYNAQADNVYSSAQAAADAYGQKYGRNVSDFLTNQQIAQGQLDTQGQKNVLAKMQGQKGILAMVGQGIQSGGVQLANRNAGDSSGAQAIANAYGQLGNQQMANVNNQYELGTADLQNAQGTFNLQQQMGVSQLQGSKQDSINQIVNDARTQLASIDAQIAGASLPDRIQLEQAKQRIQNGAVQSLQQYDTQLTNGVSAIKPMGQDEMRGKAAGMASAGYNLGDSAFNYSTEAPRQMQGTGPSTSTLPVYSNTYGKKQTA